MYTVERLYCRRTDIWKVDACGGSKVVDDGDLKRKELLNF